MDNNFTPQQPQYQQPIQQSGGYGAPPPSYYPAPVPAAQPMGQVPSSGQPAPSSGGPVYEKIDRKILMQCRHKAERRWYRRLAVLNILIIVGVIAFFIYAFDDTREYAENVYNSVVASVEEWENPDSADSEQSSQKTEELDKIEEQTEDIPQSLYYMLEILITIVAIPFVVYFAYAQYRSMSVRITEKTYPEIYAIVEEYSQKLGLKRVPKIYMVQGNGVLNAFSTFIPFKQYIEIYADLLEVAYREHHDMDTIRFIIAHEMGHIYYKHATMHYYYAIMFSQLIPILGSTASRAREYSCDRLAQLLSGSDGVDAMMSLTAGIHLYKQVDHQDYIEHAKTVKGFFVFCYNLVCDHPITTKRVLALVDPEKKSGKLY